VTTVAYLNAMYARVGDTFIRSEVQQLRDLGHTVHTFSIREASAADLVFDEIRAEHANTDYILSHGIFRLLGDAILEFVRVPGKWISTVVLATRCGWPGLRGRLWPYAYFLEACYLSRQLRKKGVNHLHDHNGQGCAFVAMLASALSDVPYSLTIHGPGEFDRPTLLALAEKVGRSKFAVAISEYGRSQLFRWVNHAHWPKVKVVHCGLEATYLDAAPVPPPATPRLVCIGRLSEQKGQLLLIDAASHLAKKGIAFELVLVGDGELRAEIENLIEKRNLGKHVRVTGAISSEQLFEEMLAARALVLPSFAEGLPRVIMEVMALRRPVLTTYVAGIPELVLPGINGWLFPAGSVDALTAAMEDCLSRSVDELRVMGEAAFSRVRERHCAETEVAKLAALFQQPSAT
jgi:colanic acid/amylovoran biosynthesis glycosyltransferase